MLKFRFLLASTAMASVLAASPYAQAMAQNGDRGEDLADALNRVAGESNIEILFAPELVDGMRIPLIANASAPDAALSQMLAGTGLMARQTRPNVYVVTNASASAPAAMFEASATRTAVATEQEALDAPPVQRDGAPGSIEGRLVESATGTGLSGAVIRLEGTRFSAVTDERGFFRMAAVPPGEYTLAVSYIGAPNLNQRVTVAPGEDLNQNLSLVIGGPDVITVYGTQSGFLQALNQQRNAENNRTVISADLLGTFPAETITEALRRVPGVSFERDPNTGEGNRASVRGIFPDAVNIQLNGLQLQGTGIERAVDLTGFLADNISQVTIQKSLLPENEGTGNGGLIEIETRSALDFGEQAFNFGIEHEFSGDSAFGDETQFNASAVRRFGDRFGLGANIQYRTSDRRNFDTLIVDVDAPVLPAGFTRLFQVPFTFIYPFGDGLSGRLITGGNYFIRDREEETLTGSVFAAWDVHDSTRLRLEYQRIQTENDSETARSSVFASTFSTNMPIPELGGEVRQRTYVRGLQPSLGLVSRQEEVTTDVLSLRGDTTLARWTFDYKAGYSRTQRDIDSVVISGFSDRASNVLDLFDSSSIVINPDVGGVDRVIGGVTRTAGDGIAALALSEVGLQFVLNPDTYHVASALEQELSNETEIFTGEFNAEYEFQNPFLNTVKFGLKYDNITRTNSDDILSTNAPTALSIVRRLPNRPRFSEFGSDLIVPFSFDDIGAGSITAPFIQSGSARSIFDQMALLAEANPGGFIVNDNRTDPGEDTGALSTAQVDEERFAGYVQGEVQVGDFTVTGGVRFERIEETGNAIGAPLYRQSNGVFVNRLVLSDLGLVRFFNNSGTSDKWLPSVVATYRPGQNWVGRFAYNRTIFSPDLTLVNRPVTVFVDQRPGFETAEIREGNPGLDPEVNDNFEIGLERYFGNRPAYIKGAVFYKDISGNITNVVQVAEPADVEQRVLDFLAPLIALEPDLALVPETEFLLRRPENGEGGQIYGLELEGATNLDFLPASWPGFLENVQLLANMTWTDASFPTLVSARDENGDTFSLELDRPLENQAEWVANFSIGYEQAGFSGRLLYTYQSELVTGYDEFNLNTVVPDFETLDLIATYTFERGSGRFIAFFEADNLLVGAEDADVLRGAGSLNGDGRSGDFFFPTNLQFNGGRTFTIGLRATF